LIEYFHVAFTERSRWLISTARFKAIDTLRRRARFDASRDEFVRYLEAQSSSAERSNEEDSLEDDRLRLIFTCCHPALPPEGQVALTLREICGLNKVRAIFNFVLKEYGHCIRNLRIVQTLAS
jgi:predicted RNA polymerase sigma factor